MLSKGIFKWLALTVSLISFAAHSIESAKLDELLLEADQIKSSDHQRFTDKLDSINLYQSELSEEQSQYFQFLLAYKKTFEGKLDKSIQIYRKIESSTKNKELRFRSRISLVNLFALQKEWLSGFWYLERLMDTYKGIDNVEIRHLGVLASVLFYNELGEFERSIKLTDQLILDGVSGRNKCIAFSMQIQAKLELENLDTLEEIEKAIKFCDRINESTLANVLKSYLATYYVENAQPEKAIALLVKNLNSIDGSNHELLSVKSHGILSQAYLALNQLEAAERHALYATNQDAIDNYYKIAVSTYEVLSQIAMNQSDYKRALEFQNRYIEYKQKLFEQIKAKQFAVESAKHQIREKDNEIAMLSKQNEVSRLELATQKQRLLIWIIVIVSISAIIFLWFYRKAALRELEIQKQLNWELQELDKLKDRILTNTSHELRTPLNGIIGLSDLILLEHEEELDDEIIKSIRMIGKSGTRLSLIVNDILDLAQLKAGKMKFRFTEFNVAELVSEVIAMCKPLIKGKDLMVSLGIDNDQSMTITHEENRLEQVLFNLIGNAIKFTEKGMVSVSFEAMDSRVYFYVKDTGRGVPKDKTASVFRGFEQVDNTDSRDNQGTGIGLAICKEIIIALGGEIYMESELEHGTTVIFWVPLKH